MRFDLVTVVVFGLIATVAILGLDRAGLLRDKPVRQSRVSAPVTPPATVQPAAPAAATPQFVTDEEPDDLPPGEHRDLTFYTCTACHGFKIVSQQGQTRERWESTIDFMVERHKMPTPSAEVRSAVAEYLFANWPPRRRAPVNPFLR